MAAIDFDLLFDRLGKVGKIGYVLAGDQSAIPALLQDLFDEYETTTDNELIGSLLASKASFYRSVVSPASSSATVAAPTLIKMVNASVPSISSRTPALVELIRQMGVESESVDECTVSASAAALSTNQGSGVVVISTKRGDGLIQQNIVAEVGRLVCTSDSYTGGQTVGQEPFQYTGQPQTAGTWDYNWPTGSAAATGVNAVAASQDASTTGNLLTNSDMEDWSTDVIPELSNWVMSGTWGTDMERSATALGGTYSLALLDGTTANIYQTFNDPTDGTQANVSPYTSYAVNFWARAVAGTVSGGVLTVELVDGTGTVINDQQGVANSFTLTLSTLTTSWVAVNGVFRIPEVPPSTIRLRFRVSTALADDDVLIDDVALTPLTAAYQGGWGFAVFSNPADPFVTGDGWDVTAANDRASATYGATFQTLFDRFFGMRGLGLLLPYSGSATQPDTKIVS